MTHVLIFRPEVEDEAIEAYAWYEARSAGLGEAFLRELYEYAREIAEDPLRYRKIRSDFRRRVFTRFPYAIYFRVEGNTVIILAVVHCARNPNAIARMLHDRNTPEA